MTTTGTAFKDAVRISARGGEVPVRDDMESHARALWQRALTEAARTHSPESWHGGQRGWRWEGKMSRLVYDLWPGLRDDAGDRSGRGFRLHLYRYLKAAQNLVCLDQGHHIPGETERLPAWWIRASYSTRQQPGNGQAPRPAVKVTAAEAGENRKAGLVRSEYACRETGCRYRAPTMQGITTHHLSAHKDAVSYVIDAMTRLGKPAVLSDIHDAAARGGFPASREVTRKVLLGLHDAGVVQRREARWGARAVGWAFAPAGTSESDWAACGLELTGRDAAETVTGGARYACREPGCGQVFAKTDDRRRHERVSHKDTGSRPYTCPVTINGRPCAHPFYSELAAAIHIGKGHNIRKNTPAYKALMSQVKAQAPARAAQAAVAAIERGSAPEPDTRPVPQPQRPSAPAETAADTNGHQPPAGSREAAYAALTAILDDRDQLALDHDRLLAEAEAAKREAGELRSRLDSIRAAIGTGP